MNTVPVVPNIPEELMIFTPRLQDDLKKNDERNTESIILYLEMCQCMFENNYTIRDVLNFIKYTQEEHVKELANEHYPLKPGPEKTLEDSLNRTKFMKAKNQENADAIIRMGNKILQFLVEINEGIIEENPDYKIILQSKTDELWKTNLKTWIANIPSDKGFQSLLNPQQIATEKLFLSVNDPRNRMTSLVSDHVICTVQALSEREKL